jgi:hypothetical protein
MSNDAFDFVTQTDRPLTHHEARRKIAMLTKEIQDTYIKHIRQSTGKTCDICGGGDLDEKRRVHDCVNGYEHREYVSPVLCFNHYCGWRITFRHLERKKKVQLLGLPKPISHMEKLSNFMQINRTVFDETLLSDEDIDLHFTRFLAKQLLKAARQSRNKGS